MPNALRLLIVEPSHLVGVVFERMCLRLGIEARVVETGTDGLAVLAEVPVDAVVTAFELGDMQADQFIRQAMLARQGHPLPAALFSASTDPQILLRAQAAGYKACFTRHQMAEVEAWLTRLVARHVAPPPLHVLVAEDSVVNQRVVVRLVEKLGHRVSLVEDGAAALALGLDEAAAIDVILMDVEMPVMDGLEATRQLRAAGWQRPIFALTAHEDDAHRQACKLAGMNEVMTKPLVFSVLAAKLATCRAHAN